VGIRLVAYKVSSAVCDIQGSLHSWPKTKPRTVSWILTLSSRSIHIPYQRLWNNRRRTPTMVTSVVRGIAAGPDFPHAV
jgi:hypothetical protein